MQALINKMALLNTISFIVVCPHSIINAVLANDGRPLRIPLRCRLKIIINENLAVH